MSVKKILQKFVTRASHTNRTGRGALIRDLIKSIERYELTDAPLTDGLRKRPSRMSLARQQVLPKLNANYVMFSALADKPYALRFRVNTPNEANSGTYPTFIDFLLPAPSNGKRVQWSCGCNDNWGRFNYANYRAGVSFQHDSKGTAANSKNKSKWPGGCKHLLALVMLLVKNKFIDATSLTLTDGAIRLGKNTLKQQIAKLKAQGLKPKPPKLSPDYDEVMNGRPFTAPLRSPTTAPAKPGNKL